MAQAGFTPISLYYSTTAAAVPTAGNLANGELALNIADMKLYAKNSAGTVTLLASSGGATGTVSSVSGTGTVNGLTLTGTVTTSGSLTLGGTLSGTASININGTVGATTPSTGAFTTLSATGNLTSLTAQFGNNPASVSVGVIGISNQKRIYGRNAANSADINILFVDGNNNVVFGPNDNATFTSTSLGIGTNSPSYAVDIRASASNSLLVGSSANAFGSLLEWNNASGFGRVGTLGGYPFDLATNGSTRFRIGDAGQFGIGGSTYGTAGQVLTSGGSGAAPTWATAGGGTTMLFCAFSSTGGL